MSLKIGDTIKVLDKFDIKDEYRNKIATITNIEEGKVWMKFKHNNELMYIIGPKGFIEKCGLVPKIKLKKHEIQSW